MLPVEWNRVLKEARNSRATTWNAGDLRQFLFGHAYQFLVKTLGAHPLWIRSHQISVNTSKGKREQALVTNVYKTLFCDVSPVLPLAWDVVKRRSWSEDVQCRMYYYRKHDLDLEKLFIPPGDVNDVYSIPHELPGNAVPVPSWLIVGGHL